MSRSQYVQECIYFNPTYKLSTELFLSLPHKDILSNTMAHFLWRSTPRSTKFTLTCLFTVSLLILILKIRTRRIAQTDPMAPSSLLDIVVPFLQLIPRSAIFYPWVFATAIFAEVTFFSFLLSTVVLYIGTGYVEKFWGYREVVKYILLVGVLTNLFTVIVAIVSNIFRGDVAGMDKPLGGGISYLFAFLVVIKRLIPEHNVVLFHGLINFRIKHLPFILLVLVTLWSSIFRTLHPAVPSLLSFFIAYIYLRFFQIANVDPILPVASTNEEGAVSVIRGDGSDAFQLVEFFPGITKPYLSILFNAVYKLSVSLGLVTPFDDDFIEQSNLRAQKLSERLNQANKLIANSVAERRRQVALQVIEDRMNGSS